MKPFFFGEQDKNLFGVYHAPAESRPVGKGVVLCYPFGFEYMTSHRAFRQLARQLSRSGFHVLRFDYFGTGDSAGDGEMASVGQWLEDIATAVAELRDMASIRRVSLVGFKLGAALAAVASTRLPELDALCLWDPVVRGSTFLEAILGERQVREKSGVTQVSGFPMTGSFAAEVGQIDLLALPRFQVRRAEIVASRDSQEDASLARHIESMGVPVSHRKTVSSGSFGAGDGFSSAVLLPEVQEAIVSFMNEDGRD
jgi:pimeloyl-ACP methyl ester carboxylesterase